MIFSLSWLDEKWRMLENRFEELSKLCEEDSECDLGFLQDIFEKNVCPLLNNIETDIIPLLVMSEETISLRFNRDKNIFVICSCNKEGYFYVSMNKENVVSKCHTSQNEIVELINEL